VSSFKRKRKIYHLDFEGTEYDGLEVKVRGLTTGEYLEFATSSAPTDEGSNETEETLRLLASHLVSWNLEDEETGDPVPTTFEGIKTNDFQMNMSIVNAWTASMVSIPEATGKKSDSGGPVLVESIPSQAL
jgi:hypothetical protein